MRLMAHIYYTLTASIAGGVVYMCDVCLSVRPSVRRSVGLSHVVPTAPHQHNRTRGERQLCTRPAIVLDDLFKPDTLVRSVNIVFNVI